eukprot:gene29733-33567_t
MKDAPTDTSHIKNDPEEKAITKSLAEVSVVQYTDKRGAVFA